MSPIHIGSVSLQRPSGCGIFSVRVVRKGVDPDGGRRAAAVVLPLAEALAERRVGQPGTVGGVRGLDGVGQLELLGKSADHRHREELV